MDSRPGPTTSARPVAAPDADQSGVPVTVQVTDIPIGVVLVEAGVAVAVNAAAAETLRLDGANAAGQPMSAWFESDSRDEVERVLTTAGHEPVTTMARISGDIGPRIIEIRTNPGDGGVVVVVVRDVTDEVTPRAIMEALFDGYLVLSPDAEVTWRDPGSPPERHGAHDAHPMSRIHPEDLPTLLDHFTRALEEPGLCLSFKARTRDSLDADRWESVSYEGFSGLEDPVIRGIVVVTRSIDHSTEVTAIGEGSGQFHSLAEAAPVGIMVTDMRGRTLYRNRRARTLLGPEAEALEGTTWITLARSGDQIELTALITAALDGDPGYTTAAFDVAGATCWIQVHTVPQRSTEGRVVGVIATLQDVTAVTEARAEIDRLVRTLDAASDLVVIFGVDGTARYANHAVSVLLGINGGDTGRQLMLSLTPDSRAVFKTVGLPVLLAGRSWRGEVEVEGEHGTVPLSVVALPLLDDTDEVDSLSFIARDITEVKEAEARLRHLASHDGLTGVANRAQLMEHLHGALSESAVDRVAVLFLDLDGFKDVNDTLGHDAGDEVLVEVTRRLERMVRKSDVVARLGGDEFVVLVNAVDDEANVERLAVRITSELKKPMPIGGQAIHISASIGIAFDGPESCTADVLLARADEAMYRAKATGKGVHIVAAPHAVEPDNQPSTA